MHRVDFDLLDLGPYQNQCQIGKFQFPFQFQIPQECVPSFFSTERWYSKIGIYMWEIRAQFIPVDESKQIKVTKSHYCSNYTGFREIIIRNPMPKVPQHMMEPFTVKHQKNLSTGFLGLGKKQTATFSATVPKQVYAMGEQVTVTVQSDNSYCEKAME